MRNILIVTGIAILLLSSCSDNIKPSVIIYTESGEIHIELETEKAPITATNFLNLCKNDVYSGSIFYRTVNEDNQDGNKVKIDVIQGGLFNDSIINQYPVIPHETTVQTGIRHHNGTISMARNEPGSASTEFFICIGDQPELDYDGKRNPDRQGFSAFGTVTQGMDVVLGIHRSENRDQYIVDPVAIDSIKILN